MNFTNWNKMNVDRPIGDYRTCISKRNTNYNVFSPDSMISQIILYRWSRSLEFIQGVAIADLHAYLFFHQKHISKWTMGTTIHQVTPYHPAMLKGKTRDNPRAAMMYFWRKREDLQYGLEWMIAMWAWSLEYKWEDLANMTDEERRKIMLRIFDEMAALNDDDFDSLYVRPVLGGMFEEPELFTTRPDWDKILNKKGVEEPVRNEEAAPIRPTLRALSAERTSGK